ncbi:MAG: YesL family protein [Vallitalea sp.]|jgi:uncharacterized membrane protein YesL|nr:YesL family protein [Vallitalea sp.]
MNFFNIDGPFQRIGSFVFDIIVLGLIFSLISIPLITIGAALTALYAACYIALVKEEGYVFNTFFRTLKDKFIKSTLVWIILIIFYALMYFNITSITKGVIGIPWLLPLYYSITIEILITSLYIFPLLSISNLGIKKIFKYSFILANKHLPTSILCGAIMALYIVAFVSINPIIVIILTSVICYIFSQLIIKRILTKYDISMW